MANNHHSSEGERGLMVGLVSTGQASGIVAANPLVHYSRRTVQRWDHRFQEEGYQGLRTRPRTGRPRTVTDEDVTLLRASILAMPFRTLQEVVLELTPHLVPHMKTVYRRVKESRLRAAVAARKPELTEEHRQMRLDFAVEHIGRTLPEWRATVVSDEKSFRSCQSRDRLVWRERGTRYEEQNILARTESGRVTAMFYGACSAAHGGLVFQSCPPRMNNEDYRNLCLQPLHDRMEELEGEGAPFDFIQDNSGVHTAGAVREWLAERPHMRPMQWPSRSPDLHWIENCWGLITLDWEERAERTRAELEANVIPAWNALMARPEILQRLADSMPRRLQEVIDRNGGSTHY